MLNCPDSEDARSHFMSTSHSGVTSSDHRFASILRLALKVFRAKSAVVSVFDDERIEAIATVGIASDLHIRIPPWCHPSAEVGAFIVPSIHKQDQFHLDQNKTDQTIQYVAASPLLNPEGTCIGSLCIFDTVPHVQEDSLDLLRDSALLAQSELQRRFLDSVQHDLISQIKEEQHRALRDPIVLDDLIVQADDALYESKRTGRNRLLTVLA